MKADLVLKVYTIVMQNMVRPAENCQENVDNHQDNKIMEISNIVKL